MIVQSISILVAFRRLTLSYHLSVRFVQDLTIAQVIREQTKAEYHMKKGPY